MTLKLHHWYKFGGKCFGTILNNMTLKQAIDMISEAVCFGTILNNMTLKLFQLL
ncbi:TPA: hypothetical protein J8W90_001736 [Enterococcus faecalis]|nr:hypothetical protein [Enterococcus faecalis]